MSNFILQNLGVGSNKGWDVPSLAGQQLDPKYAVPLGNAVEWVGDKLNLPEGGMSELIAGGPTKHTDPFKLVKTTYVAETGGGNTTNYGDLVSALVKSGYNQQDAENAARGPDAGKLRDEYLGGSSNTPSAYDMYKQKNPYSDITPGWNPDEFEAQLNEIYNNAMARAGKQTNYLTNLRDTNLADIQSAYDTSKGTLDTSKAQSLGTLGESEVLAKQQQESALNAATRLYNELLQGYSQRYGGASGAGEFASAIANAEAQRTMGSTRQATQNTLRQLATEKSNVEQNYQNSLIQLQQLKQQSINEANNTFNAGMLQIESDKATAANEKALAKMNLLKEYKTQLFNIQSQAAAFEQQISLMREQANIELDSYAKQLAASNSAGSNALGNLYNQTTTNPTTNLAVTNSYNPTTGSLYTGQIGKDELKNNFLQGVVSLNNPDKYFLNR